MQDLRSDVRRIDSQQRIVERSRVSEVREHVGPQEDLEFQRTQRKYLIGR